MKITLQFVFVLIIFQSCVFIRMDDSIDLGGNYRYIQDTPQSIIFHEADSYEGTGVIVVPYCILSYSYNDKFIIAKTQEVEENSGRKIENSFQYWIVNKELKESNVKLLDFESFNRKLIELNIDLKLNN